MKAVEESQQRFIDHRVAGDVSLVGGQLPGIGQYTVDQQVGDFHEGTLGRQLLDWIAAIQQHAVFAVDVGDLAFAAGGYAEGRVEGEDTVILVDRGHVEHVGTNGARMYR